MNIDLTTNKSILANQLKADLSRANYYIDFEKDDTLLTDEDFYQIGRSLILPENIGKPYSMELIVDKIKADFDKIKQVI
jgi:hypothetical protein